jgi:signal transduction histidine kinase
MTAAVRPMFFKKNSNAPKKRRKRRTIAQHVRVIKDAPSKLRERVTQELYKRNAELAVRNKTLALLRKLDEISLSSQKIEEMAQQIVDAIAGELGYEVTAISLIDTEKVERRCVAVSSSHADLAKSLKNVCPLLPILHLSDTPDAKRAVEKGEQTYSDTLSKVYAKGLVSAIEKVEKQANIAPSTHSMILPLRFGNETLGLLSLSTSRSFKDSSQYEHESLSGIVGLVSLALYKAKIYDDLQRTSAQLVAANEQLKDLDKAKSEFLSIASHQLRTPLTALRGYISMLEEGDYGPIADEQKPILDILNKSAVRLIDLINNLLDISRIESGRFELNLESLDIVEIAKELVGDLLPNAINKKLQLQFHDPVGEVPHVVVDSQRIRQVMLNFIDNSIKYTPAGSVDVFVQREGDEVVFSVKDTGKGIEKDELERLFNKFSRVGGASRFHTEGSGLGLYVAKQIIKEHHGEVIVESEGRDKGSTFGMRIPVEGSPKSLVVGEKASVVIKAAEAQGKGKE